MDHATRVHKLLIEAGLPVVGVSVLRPDAKIEPEWYVVERPNGAKARLDFADDTTDLQKTSARDVVLKADLRPRKAKTAAAIVTELMALTAARREKILIRWFAEAVVADSQLARRLGEAIDGDELA